MIAGSVEMIGEMIDTETEITGTKQLASRVTAMA